MNSYVVVDVTGAYHQVKADEYAIGDDGELAFYKKIGEGVFAQNKAICIFARNQWIKMSVSE